jgi:putative chitinase
MIFDRKTFFDGFRAFLERHQKSLSQARVDALSFQLDQFEADKRWFDRRHIAYALATECVETAWTFEPIEEIGHGHGRSYGKPDAVTGKVYYGRGYVQLTWKKNYEHAGNQIGVDLANDPDRAMDPLTAFGILTLGMFKGWFTGKKLSDYINANATDYVHARKIINGLDRASEIAQYAEQIEDILNSAAAPAVQPTENLPSSKTADAPDKSSFSESAKIEPPPNNLPQTVTVPPVPLYVKVVAIFTGLAGIGINAGTLVQEKLSQLTPLQLLYCIAALGLVYLAVEFIRRERKAKTQMTNLLIEKAADPASNTVELKK